MKEGLKVVWATDGSRNCLSTADQIRSLILPTASDLLAVTVAPQPMVSGARMDPVFLRPWSKKDKDAALARALARAEESALALRAESPVVRAESRFGHPIQEVLRAADEMDADLIVVGAKGHSNLKLMLVGSVAQGILDYARRPVLVCRSGPTPIRTVIAGIDGSKEALRAVEFLTRLSFPKEAVLVMLRAVELISQRPRSTENASFAADARRINDEAMGRAEYDLAAAHDVLAGWGGTEMNEIQAGRPADEILKSAAQHEAGLIVMGSRQPSRAKRYLIGSVAEHVARESLTSVLVVR